MFDSRTDAPRNGVHHERHNYKRENLFAGYSVFGSTYRSLHQAPAMTIEEGLREYQDDLEERNCQNDGLVIEDEGRAWRKPYTTQSAGYTVAVTLLTEKPAKPERHYSGPVDPYTGYAINRYGQPSGFVSVRTRRNAYAR